MCRNVHTYIYTKKQVVEWNLFSKFLVFFFLEIHTHRHTYTPTQMNSLQNCLCYPNRNRGEIKWQKLLQNLTNCKPLALEALILPPLLLSLPLSVLPVPVLPLPLLPPLLFLLFLPLRFTSVGWQGWTVSFRFKRTR